MANGPVKHVVLFKFKDHCDEALINELIEGYKAAAVPKLEIHRPSHGKPPLWPENPHVVAVASDVGAEELALGCPLPVLPINEPARIAEFILDYLDAR